MKHRLLVGALLVAGCAGRQDDGSSDGTVKASPESTPSLTTHTRALSILGHEDTATWSWARHGSARIPSHVTGRSAPVIGGEITPFVATMAFLERFEDTFSIHDPASHFRHRKVQRDHLGMTHLRLQQVERGVPVHGAEMMAHYDASGALRTIDTTYVPELEHVDVVPELTAAEALAIAERHFGTTLETTEIEVDTAPELVVHVPVQGAEKGSPALAYHLDLRTPSNVHVWMDYVVDAHTGEVIRTYNKVQSLAGVGVGVLGDTKPIEVSQDGDRYTLADTMRTPNGILTYDAQNTGVLLPPFGLVQGTAKLPGVLVTSRSPSSGWDRAAVDAHHYAGVTYDYYKKMFGRKGIDDADSKIVSSVHVAKKWSNAQWAEFTGKQMLYGDGDGVKIGEFSGAVDVIAHELTHGVTFATSKLQYLGQSGALNESISDMFAMLVEHYTKPDPQKNWVLAEDILLGDLKGRHLRDMAHPGSETALSQQPAHMSEYRSVTDDLKLILDLGGVHVNSGIPNNAFYLMTMGGTNDVSKVEVKAGLGWEKSAQVWYRTNTQYLTESSNFAAAAAATMSAANDLNLTENEKNIVECAWIAVGVLEGSCKTIAPQPDDGRGNGTGDGNGNGEGPNDDGNGSMTGDAGTSDGTANAGESDDSSQGSGCNASAGSSGGIGGIGGLVGLAIGAVVTRGRRRRRS